MDMNNKAVQALVGVILVTLVGAIVHLFVLREDRNTIARTNTQIAELERKINVAKAIQKSATELEIQMQDLKKQLERLKRILPIEVNKPKFMADIKRIANENGIEIMEATNNKFVVDDVIVEHPFTYIARGNYHDFGNFFAQLSNYPQIVNIKGLSLERDKDPAVPVVGSFIISVYTYREPSEEDLKRQIQEKKNQLKSRGKKSRKRNS